ncbi:MAG TPA: HAD hydrolase-like protein [Longimicrobium sp.]|nr:HAD hydrolase-like protein [Longimicrobium sp.]
MRYRLAVFDFDGTLADSYPWFVGAMNHVADRYRFRRVEAHELDVLRGLDARGVIEHLGVPMWKMPFIVRHMRRRIAADAGRIALFPGAGDLLRRLAESGVAIALVTTNTEANVRRILGPENARLVRHWGCGASMFGKRPRIRKVLRDSRVPPAEAVCVGDELRDLHAARAEGVAFAAVTWGFTAPAALRAHAPEAVFDTMAELADALAPAVPASTDPASTGHAPGG